jgi:subtilisin family serine protease
MPYPNPAPWNHAFVACRRAWGLVPPKSGDAIDWGDVRVAHLDTGYTFHPAFGFAKDKTHQPGDLSGIIVEDGGDFFEPSRGTAFDPLESFAPILNVELQPRGHGTFSGSVLAGLDPEDRFYGVAPGLPLVSLRVTEGSVLLGRRAVATADAITRVVEKGLAPVINISVGTPAENPRIRAALNRAYEAGIIVVCAGGQVIGQVVYPALYARAISVGGVRRIIVRGEPRFVIYAAYSSYAPIDVWAPAAPIRRGHVEPSGTRNGPYTVGYFPNADGTTYAATHVSAAAALWLRLHGRKLDERYGPGWPRVEAFRKLLRDRTINTQRLSSSEKKKLGKHWGKTACLNIHGLLQAELPAVTDAEKAPVQRPAEL